VKPLTRREFLTGSVLVTSAAFTLMACQPITRPAPTQKTIPTLESGLLVDLEALVEATMQEFRVPGMAVGVVQDGALVYANGFGVMNIDTKQPVTPQSVFSMASVSKAFTGTAIMQLVETGKIDIDEPMTTYVPYFQLADERYKAITIRHLLAHTSGLPALAADDFFAAFENPEYDDGAAERYVRSLHPLELSSAPGETFSYSDMGYNVLGDVIAKVSGELFEEYIQHHLFTPLGMTHSTFLVNEVDPDRLVAAHVLDDATQQVIISPIFPYNRSQAPSSCLHSNVEDMSRWLIAHLNGGELAGTRILSPASHETLWSLLSTPDYGGIWQDYAWGWWLGNLDGEPTIMSAGAQPGVQTMAGLLVPEHSLAVIALGNYLASYDDPFYAVGLAEEVTKLILGINA
jgi:CubicO group peptidase (beta-lactamase class C family)